MNAFAPDFSQLWLFSQGRDSDAQTFRVTDEEPLSPSLQEALDALAERINAARSIV